MAFKNHMMFTDLPQSAERKLDSNANINLPRETSRIRGMIHQKKKMPHTAGPIHNNNMVEPQKLLQTKSKHGKPPEEDVLSNQNPMLEPRDSQRAS